VKGFRRILVPLDFSPVSARLVEHASNLVADDGVVHLLHVVEWVPRVVDGAFMGYPDAKQVRELHAQSERKLEEYARSFHGPTVEREVCEGDAAPTILDVAARGRFDLIVLATKDRGGLGHLLLGSVAEKLLHKASTPLLIARA
jgi:nucleotide-binding universal stress UspA family protein